MPFAIRSNVLTLAPGFHQVDVVGTAVCTSDSDSLMAVSAAAIVVDLCVGLFAIRILGHTLAAARIVAVIRRLESPLAFAGLSIDGDNFRANARRAAAATIAWTGPGRHVRSADNNRRQDGRRR